jgi:hypothetical protein
MSATVKRDADRSRQAEFDGLQSSVFIGAGDVIPRVNASLPM